MTIGVYWKSWIRKIWRVNYNSNLIDGKDTPQESLYGPKCNQDISEMIMNCIFEIFL